MAISYGASYKDAGVDVNAGYKSVELIKGYAASTVRPGAVGGLGGFGGMFSLKAALSMKDPVMVSGTDGVGTKLALAFLLNKHDTVGQDCVAMCVNDIICSGAEPLFFLDYIACGRNIPEKTGEIVKGVAEGCLQAGVFLAGGETAEHPGLMPEDEYDLAGFSAGIVERDEIIDGKGIKPGDVLLGLASNGLHSNGFSLVRKVFGIGTDKPFENAYIEELGGKLGDILLTPTRIYVKPVLELIKSVKVKGMAHITGGGFYENIPRILPDGLSAVINTKSYKTPPVFSYLEQKGGISRDDMYGTYNMGIGLVVCVSPEDVNKTTDILTKAGETVYEIGKVMDKGQNAVCLE